MLPPLYRARGWSSRGPGRGGVTWEPSLQERLVAERRAEPLQHLLQQHHPSPWPRRHQVGKGRTEWLCLPRDGQAAGWGASSRDTQTPVPGAWATVHRLLETWKLSKISTARPFTITGAAQGIIQGRGPLFCPCSTQALSSDVHTHSFVCPGKMQRYLSMKRHPQRLRVLPCRTSASLGSGLAGPGHPSPSPGGPPCRFLHVDVDTALTCTLSVSARGSCLQPLNNYT